ncbi:Y-family DNA polymerase [Flavobacterium microcysteis]|uniref:Y-family DNA polymerase n=1 Tax=Flavobacterium microcysteis TaxID=2596891 RepID=A0A501Q6I4_9FLAO|nr:Y-family DNA polymerase [Flavobacterium microcysteis]TPD68539.1 Y-family DNA polymerase [Flavobacterium microcysteis]
MYALVDCNNFYASCERVFQPQYNGKPVVVLSNNDGCIISRSDEAKALGVPMAAPEFKVREMLRQNNIKVFSSNYALYGDMSRRAMNVLNKFTPYVEVYSIDEAFLNFEGMNISDYDGYGKQIKNTLLKGLSLPVCIGFAPTKALSKVANKIARKYPERTNGVYVIDTEEKRVKALRWTKIEDVWGIGYRMKKKMKAKNILTAYDFTEPFHESWIKKEMGVIGLRLRKELLGESVLGIEEPGNKKSIAITRSFPKQLTDFDALRERVSTFASVCAEKLRLQNSCCHTVVVMLATSEHKTPTTKHYYHNAVTLPFGTDSTLTINQAAIRILEKLYEEHKGERFQKAGVIVTQLINTNEKQLHLFEEENPKHHQLMKAIDKINTKIGDRKVKLGSQDSKTWNMKQNMLSPKYTTRLDQILVVKCH